MSTVSPVSVQVALADDHGLFREGLRALLESRPGLQVVCEADNGQELLECLDRGARPDVVLLDMQMPVLDGLQTMRLLRGQYPAVRVIILSMHQDAGLVRLLLAEGAHGYLPKTAPIELVHRTILEAVEEVRR